MKKTIKSIFLSEKGSVSSKRVCGVAGFAVIFTVYVLAYAQGRAMPAYTVELMATCGALLGIDSVAKIFKKDKE